MNAFNFRIVLCAAALGCALPAHAALSVLACEPEWAALATEIGGANIDAASATTGQQDPHRIEARPSLIARVRNADLLICTGLELESGWLPVLLQQSGNARIQPGQPGNFVAGRVVRRLEMPTALDRAQGDVHGQGNPHVQMDPHNIAKIADALAQRLSELDSAHAADYASGLQKFQQRWSEAIARWEQQAAPLHDVAVVTHHKDMVYLIAWLGMREVGNLEPKPGLEPSSSHLAGLLDQLKQSPARLVLRTPYQSERASEWLAEKAGIKAVMLPNTIGGSDAATDLFALFDDILARLLGAVK
jgi:zinc/manganese transport system substrate-binding protein